ncbi:MAG TPA: ABC transporter permease [Bryobacteraceae bacterium]|nr:ABC transporter permease [Bryobacteraceae bacterium]
MPVWNDFRIALRQAVRRPLYAATCIAVLAFGLGSCTAVFSTLYSAVLKPLPYPSPDRLVLVHNEFPALRLASMKVSPADYVTLSRHYELFSNTAAYNFLDLSLSGIEIPQKVNAVAVTSGLFRTLGVQPMLGRLFTDVEESYGGPHAVILSDAYWHSAFGGDPGVLNRALKLNGEQYTIVGVMPNSFAFPNDVTQMWTPLTIRDQANSRDYYLQMLARLAPGLTFTDAAARLRQLSQILAVREPQLHAVAPQGWSYFLSPMLRNDHTAVRRWLWILFAAVSCFLLIACSNVAGLVLVRASEQRFELAVRMALGAGKWRIARQVFAEVLVVAAGGCAAGLAIGRLEMALLARYGPSAPPQFEAPVFWFCAGLSVITILICGLYPALYSARVASTSASGRFSDGPRQYTASFAKRRWQQALTIAQVAVATGLLVCGGLLVHSLERLLQTPLGFDPGGVLTMQVSLPPLRYASPESRTHFFDAALERISALPGVQSASACTLLPFGYGENANTFEIVGRPQQVVAPLADLNTVSDGYFQTMHVPLVRGRLFTPRDGVGALPVALIDEAFDRRFFARQDPVGQKLKMPWGVFTIAGVVGSVKVSGLDVDDPPTVYFAAAQSPVTDMTIEIRSRSSGSTLVREVQRTVAEIDKEQPVYDVATLQVRIDRSFQTRRFVAFLILVFAAAGTGLAALGLYGLLSYIVSSRYREIGIRMALGASNSAIARLVCRGGMVLVMAGLALGSAAGLAAARFMASEMYGVGIGDSWTWMLVLGAVGISGFLASALPAWRAARQSPAEALRAE